MSKEIIHRYFFKSQTEAWGYFTRSELLEQSPMKTDCIIVTLLE